MMEIGNICLTCGSGAFPEVLRYCDKCKVCAQHLYCRDVLPAENLHSLWHCDDCKDHEAYYDLMDTEEKEEEGLQSTNDSVGESSSSTTNGTYKSLKAKKDKKMKRESRKKKKLGAAKMVLETILGGDEEAVEDNIEVDWVKEEKVPEVTEIGIISPDDTLDTADDGDSTRVAAKPVDVPTWRGSVNYVSKNGDKTVSRLVVHLSSLACDKVLEEAKFLEAHLHSDLVPRKDVWPKVFDMCGSQSIALYIVADNETDENVDFDKLVADMIEEDLAMRIDVEKAELLVFTSRMLTEECQSFETNKYLWGVFRELEIM